MAAASMLLRVVLWSLPLGIDGSVQDLLLHDVATIFIVVLLIKQLYRSPR